MTDSPPDPLTPADEALAVTYEVFLGLRRAGFEVHEAAAVIAAMLKASQ